MYPQAHFPVYSDGSFYIIPVTIVPCLTKAMSEAKLVSVEDVYVTGILRKQCNADTFHVPNRYIYSALNIIQYKPHMFQSSDNSYTSEKNHVTRVIWTANYEGASNYYGQCLKLIYLTIYKYIDIYNT